MRRPVRFFILGTVALLVGQGCAPSSATHPTASPNSSAPACTAPGSPPNPLVALPTAPHGIFVLVTQPRLSSQINAALLSNRDICGADFWVTWSQVDHGPGASPRYDWSRVADEIKPWEDAGKTVNLILMGVAEGQGASQTATPQWVQSQVSMVSCPTGQPKPVYWQPGYENSWKGFIAATVSHFDPDPHVGYIRFGLGQGGEDLVSSGADSGQCKVAWDANGYAAQWVPYNMRMIDFIGSLHSHIQAMVGINPYLGKSDLAHAVAAEAAKFGIGFGMQGLTAFDVQSVAAGKPCLDADWCSLFDQYAGKVPLETQTLAASNPSGAQVPRGIPGTQPGSTLSGFTGPLPPLLKVALQQHTQILEVYAEDCLVAFDPSSNGYSQYHSAYAAAFDSAAAVVGVAAG